MTTQRSDQIERDSPLAARGFGRRYRRGGPWAARDVSFVLRPGSITALVGPNGAGKSTLIRACVGFERADAGHLLVGGTDPLRLPAEALRYVGYVPQSASLYPSLTIADHLLMASIARSDFDRAYVRSRLEALGLDEQRVVGTLSGGEQAQAALALCLGIRAPLLLLDEPLASLDPLARRDFLNMLVAHVRATGATALLSSHIVTDIEQACDHLLVLNRGRLDLDTSVADAIARFAIRSGSGSPDSIGTFAGPDGHNVSLFEDRHAARRATLEEIVLGHLAAGRPS